MLLKLVGVFVLEVILNFLCAFLANQSGAERALFGEFAHIRRHRHERREYHVELRHFASHDPEAENATGDEVFDFGGCRFAFASFVQKLLGPVDLLNDLRAGRGHGRWRRNCTYFSHLGVVLAFPHLVTHPCLVPADGVGSDVALLDLQDGQIADDVVLVLGRFQQAASFPAELPAMLEDVGFSWIRTEWQGISPYCLSIYAFAEEFLVLLHVADGQFVHFDLVIGHVPLKDRVKFCHGHLHVSSYD
jgi:hypothetical protein